MVSMSGAEMANCEQWTHGEYENANRKWIQK